MSLKPIVHEVRIQNQVIFLDPPIEYARSTWIRQLHDWLGKQSSHSVYAAIGFSFFIFLDKALFVGYGEYRVLVMKSGCRCRVVQHQKPHTPPLYALLSSPPVETKSCDVCHAANSSA
jgi:hypothetical protein